MTPPTRLLLLAALVLGCATGSGAVEEFGDEDAGEPVEDDTPPTAAVDALLFPFLDHPSDAPVNYGSTDVPSLDAGAARDVAPIDTGVACPALREACGGGCVDTSINPAHCGGCDRACGVGETCVAGACQSACAAPRSTCGSACVDRSTDVTNCGACGVRCLAGQGCTAGVCTSACPAPRSMCGTACVDPSTDVANCGACGLRCATAQTCTAGVCSSATSSGSTGVGQACSRSNLCSGGLLCRIDWPAGYCTDYCATDTDCDVGSMCISDGFDDFCARSCTTSSQCRTGYGCYRITATQGACAPL